MTEVGEDQTISHRERGVSRYANYQPPPLHSPEEREMRGDIVKDARRPAYDPRQEDYEDIGIIDTCSSSSPGKLRALNLIISA